MRITFLIISFVAISSFAANAEMPKDMLKLCSIDDGTLKNPGEFPRWLPPAGSALFESFNNLTSHYGRPHKECDRHTTVSHNRLSNEGKNCDFATDENEWTTHLTGKISAAIEIRNGSEITRFDTGFAPKFEWRNSDGKVMIANELTRLCRRHVNGKFTDEIILEMQDAYGYYSYVILDVYPSDT